MCVAQITKMVIYLITQRERKIVDAFKDILWRTGGMPSSHSAIVCSLVTSSGIAEGISSNFFILTLVFAMIVLRDSMGVRRAAGLQAKAINSLGKQFAERNGLEFNSVKEIQGHTPLEIIAGALLGILIAVIFYLLLL
jgi:acid phosphatase family membrane protein YuiD